MGLILFVNQNTVSDSMVGGKKFLFPKDSFKFMGFPTEMGCRASRKIPITATKTWFSRFKTARPKGCYLGEVDWRGSVPKFYTKPDASIPNLVWPYAVDSSGALTSELDKTHFCFYQCSKWKSMSVQTVLLHGGTILAGGVFIERLTNFLTSRYGFKMINSKSTPADVKRAIDLTLYVPPLWTLQWRRTISLLAFIFVLHVWKIVVPRIDIDGFFTVDYYVTLAFALSATYALLLRNFHPHYFTPIVFTQELWVHGKDTFRSLSFKGVHDVDLYDWFHVKAVTRAHHLLNYARRVTPNDVGFFDEKEGFQMIEDKKKAMKGKKLEANLTKQDMWNPLRKQLLRMEDRLNALEGNEPAMGLGMYGGQRTRTNKIRKVLEGIKGQDVLCVRTYEQHTDILEPVGHDWTLGNFRRRRVTVEVGARGKCVGKSHDGKLLVLWPNDDLIDIVKDTYTQNQDIDDSMIPHVLLETPFMDIIEIGPEWDELETYVQTKIDELPIFFVDAVDYDDDDQEGGV